LHSVSFMDDVIVIGSGPGGSSAACALRLRGFRVTIIEREKHPRAKLCAGGLPPKAIAVLPASISQVVECKVERIRFGFAGRRPFELTFARPVVHMVRRDQMDGLLVEKAISLGAIVRQSERAIEIREEKGTLTVGTDKRLYRARLAIAADGAGGLGARLLGRAGIRVCPAMQLEVSAEPAMLERWAKTIACDFGVVRGGIGWLFPKRASLSVGVCAFEKGVDLRAGLRAWLNLLGLDPPEPFKPRAHMLPTWDGRQKFSRGAILVAGDAAGLVNPLTGAGIRRAAVSGRLAAETASAYLAGGAVSSKDLAAYDRRVNLELVRELRRARIMARIFYRAPGLFYRLAVSNARVNPWVEQLLSGQKSYLEVFYELLKGRWPGRLTS